DHTVEFRAIEVGRGKAGTPLVDEDLGERLLREEAGKIRAGPTWAALEDGERRAEADVVARHGRDRDRCRGTGSGGWIERDLGDTAGDGVGGDRRWAVDLRGTGFAPADFDCPEFDGVIPALVERDGERRRELAAGALDACADRLAGDRLLDATTTQNHAFDVGQVMAGLGYDRWVAYGVSYGTTIGFELLRQPPAGLVGTVLDGVYPPDLDVDTSVAATAQRSIDALSAACGRSTRCTDLNPDVALSLDLLIAELDESPRIVTLSPNESGFDREVDVRLDGTRLAEFVFLLLYNESLARYLPATLTGIADGDPDAERWLARVGTRTLTAAYNANREGTYFAVQCHDRLPFTSGGFVDHDGGFGSAVPVEPLRNLCPAWEQGEAGAVVGTPVVSDLPTLLLSGTFDPITPSTFADAAADLLPNATIVTQDGRGHGIWFGNSCIAGIVQQFVADPLRTLDTSCADAGVPVDWAAP
ncbi:MAG: alpha/beta fold hydrolase, partial [Actinobacteria bacterium]|nr:alpha/beta fold hydrolase [Actinomycetota bacterium]